MPGVLSDIHRSSYLKLTMILKHSLQYYLHFIDKEAKA